MICLMNEKMKNIRGLQTNYMFAHGSEPFGFNESYLMGVSDCKVYFSPVVQKPN